MAKRCKSRASIVGVATDGKVTYWIPEAGIEMSALAFYLLEFIDPTFNLKPGSHFKVRLPNASSVDTRTDCTQKRNEYGYYINSTQGLDAGDLAAIKSDSRDWVGEGRGKGGRHLLPDESCC